MLVRERQNNKRQVRSGYTLLEMLVVVAIIVLLAGISGYMLLPRLDEAKEDADLGQMRNLTQSAQTYKIHKGDWPPSLEALTEAQPNGGAPYTDAASLVPKCMPNAQYHYDPAGTHNQGLKPDIWVDGPHGQIGNWMQKVPR